VARAVAVSQTGAVSDIEVHDDPAQSRFEVVVDGSPAGFAAYHDRDGHRTFTHTEIDPAYAGQGVGGALARAALDTTRAAGLGVLPLCPFIKGWIDKHPDYADLVVTP
jgi:uncharacterized protein